MKFSPTTARKIRQSLGLTQSQAAQAAGLSRQGLANIESGASSPTLDTINALAGAYGIPAGDLILEGGGASAKRTAALQQGA